MKAIKLTGIVLATVLFAARAMAQQAEQLVVPLSDPGKPYKLSVDIVFGSIKVTSYDGKDVVIEAQSTNNKRDDDERRDGMRKLNSNNGLDITAKEKNNTVTIGSEMPMRNLNLSIKLPKNISSLQLKTINGKGVEVSNVSSNIEVSNTNGAVVLTDVSGSVVANTINGTVKVIFKSVDPKAPMAFSTLNGVIDVTFPAGLKANVKLKSDRGNIYSDFDIATDKQSAQVTKSANEGMYRLKVDETIAGKINGGGPELLMKTMNGNIFLHKAK